MAFSFPKIYPILDSSVIPQAGRVEFLRRLGGELDDAGVTLLEYRNKTGAELELLDDAESLRAAMPAGQVKLILDDRVDLVIGLANLMACTSTRVTPLPQRLGDCWARGGSWARLAGVRHCCPAFFRSQRIIFRSARFLRRPRSRPQSLQLEWRVCADYAKKQTRRAVLVAVGGVTLETAAAVLDAGATTIGVAAAIFRAADPAAEFRQWLNLLE